MLLSLFEHIADHWFVSTYLAVMVLNESAILAAFSLAASSDPSRLFGVGLASFLGSLTNDLILFVLARSGVERWLSQKNENDQKTATFFERLLLGNVFFAFLFMKFFFGIRILLTLYLIAKKRLSLGTFLLYDVPGIFLYIVVIGSIGFFIGQGNDGLQTTYQAVVRIVMAIGLLLITTHFVSLFLRRWSKNRSSSSEPQNNTALPHL